MKNQSMKQNFDITEEQPFASDTKQAYDGKTMGRCGWEAFSKFPLDMTPALCTAEVLYKNPDSTELYQERLMASLMSQDQCHVYSKHI